MNRAFALLIAVASCSKKPSCKHEVEELLAFLGEMDHSAATFRIEPGMHLVTRTDLPRAQASPAAVVTLLPEETAFEGKRVEDIEDSLRAEGIETALRGDPPRAVHVLVDERVPWSRVVAVAEAAERTFHPHVGFAFLRPQSVQPPPFVDTPLNDLIRVCRPLQKLFAETSGSFAGDKTQHIIDGTGPALIDCDCNVDLPSLRGLMWRRAANPNPTVVLMTRVSKEGKRIELPAATPWSEAHKQLRQGQAVWLVATGR